MPERDDRPPALAPTIATAYRPVEEYLERRGASADPGEVALAPVDALLVRLAVRYQPAAPVVIDLAADRTGGATAVLCLTDPGARRTVIRPAADRPWRFALDHCLGDAGGVAGRVLEADVSPGRAAEVAGPQVPLVVLTARGGRAGSELAEEVGAWLAAEPGAVVVVLDAGPVGSCPGLAALLPAAAAADWHLTLARDLSPALCASRAVVVGRRSNPVAGTLPFRVGRLFADHFRYLDLVNERCLAAVRQGAADDPDFALRLPPDVADVYQSSSFVAHLRRELAAREQELAALRANRVYRLLVKLKNGARAAARVVPGGRWLGRKARGALLRA